MRKIVAAIFCIATIYSASAQFTLIDSAYFNGKNPKEGELVTIWGIRIFDIDGQPVKETIFDTLATFINHHPEVVFNLEVHTDCRGSDDINLSYSQQLADIAKTKLHTLMRDPSQLLQAIGKGEAELLLPHCKCDIHAEESGCMESEHSKNRRMILRVVVVRR
jgi:hypothetical protein